MNNIELSIERLNTLAPVQVVTDEAVHRRFVEIYDSLWDEGNGEAVYQRESSYFNRILADKKELHGCTRLSIFNSFIDLAINGLSLEPGTKAQCYLQGRKYKVGVKQDGSDLYEARTTLVISGYGELVYRARCGQIRYADNPVLVYAEDDFKFSDNDGRKSVSYTCCLPHTSGHVVAAFLRIVRNDGSIDYSVMFEEDWLRLKSYSARNNRFYNRDTRQYEGKANDLYSSNNGMIDTGFLQAKVIKHAFRTYPKVRIGKYTEFQSQQEDMAASQEQDIDDFYKMQQGQAAENPQQPQAFGDAPDFSNGIQVDNTDDGAF